MTLTKKNVNSVPSTEPRRRRLPKDARDNILAAAEAMLIADGPQSLKLVEVARAAGVSNATVLHHFGSIDDVQGALMERMVRQLVDEVLASTHGGGDPAMNAGALNAGEGVIALFDAFERKGAARLAAWLELRGEARRLTAVRGAVREVIDARVCQFPRISVEALEDFMLASITMALAVGLFGSTLAELMDKPAGRAREVALRLLLTQMQKAISGG
jgi:AcrR family transcriptional regulator